jgi:hypothetical protein
MAQIRDVIRSRHCPMRLHHNANYSYCLPVAVSSRNSNFHPGIRTLASLSWPWPVILECLDGVIIFALELQLKTQWL